MNILVYPHQMVIGGSQINALELAAAVRDRGHQVTVIAPDGVLVPTIAELGLRHVLARVNALYPSIRTALQLADLARRLKVDLIHSYEWRPSIEAAFGPHLLHRVPVLMTVLSMSVPKYLPMHLPIVVGTHELATAASGRRVHLVEPPVDIRKNCVSNMMKSRSRWSFGDTDIVVSVVCRLTTDLQKQQGVLQAIDVIGGLADRLPLRFLIVGGGEGLREIRTRANVMNTRLGRNVICVDGPALDPRDAYEAADFVLGMGSSALKAMSFSKPLVVQGTNGFWRLLDESTLPTFLEQGWFGHGGAGANDLRPIIEQLTSNPKLRYALGQFGRSIVEQRFSLDLAAERLIAIYEQAVAQPCARNEWLPSMMRSAAGFAKFRTMTAFEAFRGGLARST